MAQIEFISGVPGHGKSLLAITKGLAFVAEGRTVYAAGFKELDYEGTGFLPLPHPFDSPEVADTDEFGDMPHWMTLRDAVIIYDECYVVMPTRASGKPVPLHVSALARHRHYNIDLIFLSQKHDQLDNFFRGLVNQHIHVVRKFGFNGAVLKTWDSFQINTDKKADATPYWKYPKANYKFYKSATAHSVKKKIPWYLWAPIPLLAIIGGLVWYVVHNFGGSAATAPVAASAANGAGGALTRDADEDANKALRRKDYAAWLKPRVSGQPWTAPAYDNLQPQGVPDLYCIAVDDGRCECRTEQGTNYHVEAGICRTIAREGIYNPFRKPLQDREPPRREPREQVRREPEQQSATAVQPSGYWPTNTMPQDYAPPEHTIVTRGAM